MHWRNSDFQIEHFLEGSCHTPDGKYHMLAQLLEEREQALSHVRYQLRHLAWRVSWLRWLAWVPFFGIPARIRIAQLRDQQPHVQALLDACSHEIAAIKRRIERIAPLRLYRHLPDPQAHQAAQRAEWAAELKFRAENYLLTGNLPADQLAAMRQHPDFARDIWPHIERIEVIVQPVASVSESSTRHMRRQLLAPAREPDPPSLTH